MHTMNEDGSIRLPGLIDVVAKCLEVPPSEIEVGVPLSRYGLNSLSSVELITALSAATQRDLPEWLLLDCPDIRTLERFLNGSDDAGGAGGEMRVARIERLLEDAVLPREIRPAPPMRHGSGERSVLLTGVTGFLGAHLLQALLQQDGTRVLCLVRPKAPLDGPTRLRRLMQSRGLWPAFGDRVEAVEGDLRRPRLGLSTKAFDRLCREVDAVYHGGAEVNWVQPYETLRDTNVTGTVEILRLACRHRTKPVHFVSTIGVCLATPGPTTVSEEDDMIAHIAGLHFGYVQSKCVAETLLRRAAERGLPVRIYRPALISGDSRSGLSDTEGFLSSFLKGCVQMECAPDLDWLLDCCPVDHVARSIVRLSADRGDSLRVYHLDNPRPRHWRECVLWMNLYGYAVRLVPFRDWLSRLQAAARDTGHALHSLQGFFLARPPGMSGLTLPELYEEGRKSDVRSLATRTTLERLSIGCPSLNADLLDRYFESFVACGFLDAPPNRPAQPRRACSGDVDPSPLGRLFRRFHGEETLTVTGARQSLDSENSIITELASWRYGRSRGLFRYRADMLRSGEDGPRSVDVMVKIKPRDEEVIEIGQRVASLCSTELGRAYERHKHRLGLLGCHIRELAIYEQRDPRFRRNTPVCYGSLRDDRRDSWILVLEYLSDTLLMDSADDVRGWRRDHVEAAVRGLAELHAIWYGRESELARQPWLGSISCARGMTESTELWMALADHASPVFRDSIGSEIRELQQRFIDDLGGWWRELEAAPRTLTHNDFNPRNITFRKTASGPRLCVYDWELATLGVPQHDLAELLCFVLGPQTSREEVEHHVELHREALQRATGCAIDRSSWRRGFELCLRDLLLNRFAMYVLVHTFRRQRFLERIVRTWRTIHGHCARDSHARPARSWRIA